MKAITLALLSVFAAGPAFAQSNDTQPKPVATVHAAANTTVNGTAVNAGSTTNLFAGDVVSVSQGQVMVSYDGACMVRVAKDASPYTVTSAAVACVGTSSSSVGAVPSNKPATWPYIVGGIGAAAAIGAAANGGGSGKPKPVPSSP